MVESKPLKREFSRTVMLPLMKYLMINTTEILKDGQLIPGKFNWREFCINRNRTKQLWRASTASLSPASTSSWRRRPTWQHGFDTNRPCQKISRACSKACSWETWPRFTSCTRTPSGFTEDSLVKWWLEGGQASGLESSHNLDKVVLWLTD